VKTLLVIARFMLVAAMFLQLAACATQTVTERTLLAYTGRPITALIEDRRRYPDSESSLPNNGKVYRFTTGSGAEVDKYGNVRSKVCRVWVETDSAGIIVRWRYENCR
jgi:hypothetical protein